MIIGRNGRAHPEASAGLGRNLEWVVRSATRPVLVVTQSYCEPKKVFFAFDGSSVTQKGLEIWPAAR